MTLGERFKSLRKELGLSQEAIGSQGFVSTPGWIKIENNQRQASEKLIDKLTKWLVADKYIRVPASETLKEKLLILKYLGSTSPFVRELAKSHAKTFANGAILLATTATAKKSRRSAAASHSKRTVSHP